MGRSRTGCLPRPAEGSLIPASRAWLEKLSHRAKGGMVRRLKRAIRAAWYLRSKVPLLNFPIPWKLPFGPYFLLYGDGMGFVALSLHFVQNPAEEKLWKFAWRYLKTGMVVIDVGANQGLYTLLAACRVGPGGRVIAFEPAPPDFGKLERNVALNRYSQVVLENMAVGEAVGNTEFYVCLGHQGGLSSRRRPLADDLVVPTQLVTTSLTTLDAYLRFKNIARVDFLKIDVEGGELEVLKGATMLLSNGVRPVILCEVEDIRTQSWGYKAAEITSLLERYGFALYSIAPGGALRRASESYPLEGGDVVAVPPERDHMVKALQAGC
jgi:FkbM family methyltransferase